MGRGLGPGSGAVGWCYVCVRSVSDLYLCTVLGGYCTSEVHPVFNHFMAGMEMNALFYQYQD